MAFRRPRGRMLDLRALDIGSRRHKPLQLTIIADPYALAIKLNSMRRQRIEPAG
jgi:hypothetical protein